MNVPALSPRTVEESDVHPLAFCYQVTEVIRTACSEAKDKEVVSVTLLPDDLEGEVGGSLSLCFNNKLQALEVPLHGRFVVTLTPIDE